MSRKKEYKYAPVQQHETTSLHEDDDGANVVHVTNGNGDSIKMNSTYEDDEEVSFHGYKKTRISRTYLQRVCSARFLSFTKLEVVLTCVVVVLALLSTIFLALYLSQASNATNEVNRCMTRGCIQVASRISSSLDESADPCNDFYQFSCGGWFSKNPLPAGQSRWSAFDLLNHDSQAILKSILEMNLTSNSPSELKAKRYFQSCLDIDAINLLGAKPLQDLIATVGGWSISGSWNESDFDFNKTLSLLSPYSTFPFFSFSVGTDQKHSNSNVISIDENALSLSDRSYYDNKTITTDRILSAYLELMTDIGVLLGSDRNSTYQQMYEILRLEKDLALITMSLEEQRHEDTNYHRLKLGDLQAIAPAVDWMTLIPDAFRQSSNISVGSDEAVVTSSLKYLKKISDIVYKTPKRILSNYIVWRFVRGFTGALGKPFLDVLNKFHKVKYGSDWNCQDRWRDCVRTVDIVFGDALGRLFILNHFDESSKQSAQNMVTSIKSAFQRNLANIKWMDDTTKEIASEKANAVDDMIGYSDKIINVTYVDEEYEGFNVLENETYFEHYVNFVKYVVKKDLKSLREPVKKDRWSSTPPTVNAYYSPTQNNIVFPAGILQPPFYGKHFPQAINYGGIGIVVGHELTHGFDDQGRKYDLEGDLKNWWEPETLNRFQKKAACMMDQYSKYEVSGLNVNGNLTIGENIADNGGVRLAFNAYKEWSKVNGSTGLDPLLPSLNYTHEQLFFIAFAQLWCSVSTPQYTVQQIQTDVHSPPKYRVQGTVSNSPEVAEAFHCPIGSAMNPIKKCRVW